MSDCSQASGGLHLALNLLDARQAGLQFLGQGRHQLVHCHANWLVRLPSQNVTANLPVEQHQLAVHRQRRTLLGGVNTGFQIFQPIGLAGGGDGEEAGRSAWPLM